MITKAIISYSDGSEATFAGEPLNLSEVPLLSSEQQLAPIPAPTEEAVVEAAPVEVETPVEAPIADESAPAETAEAE